MLDKSTSVQQLRAIINQFIDAREWTQFHNPKCLSIAIAAEAAELMELFMWCDNEASFKEAQKYQGEVKEELADIIITAFCFARATNIDIVSAVQDKMKINAKRYPVEKAKGKYSKYDKLD